MYKALRSHPKALYLILIPLIICLLWAGYSRTSRTYDDYLIENCNQNCDSIVDNISSISNYAPSISPDDVSHLQNVQKQIYHSNHFGHIRNLIHSYKRGVN